MNPFESSIYQTPILLKGNHPDHNPTRNYKLGKSPISTAMGFTKPGYTPPTSDVLKSWTASGGWVGHLVPEGKHVIDVEDPVKISLIKGLCRQKGITPPINLTNNGVQIIFSTNGGPPLPGADGRITRMGFPVTDRSAGKNYVILPPTNGRTFENESHHETNFRADDTPRNVAHNQIHLQEPQQLHRFLYSRQPVHPDEQTRASRNRASTYDSTSAAHPAYMPYEA